MTYIPNQPAPLDLYVATTAHGEKRHIISGPSARVALCSAPVVVQRKPIPANDHWLYGPMVCSNCREKVNKMRGPRA